MQSMLDSFVNDIVSNPHRHETWLIMADWLEDQNDPRAELVRLTWQVQHESNHPDFLARQLRMQELLTAGFRPIRPHWINELGVDFVLITGGPGYIGSPVTEVDRGITEQNQQQIAIVNPFWLSVHPITQTQWEMVTDYNPSFFSKDGPYHHRVADLHDAEVASFPAEGFMYNDIARFCRKFEAPIRLPTAVEWEYACRAGTTTPWHFGYFCDSNQANVLIDNIFMTTIQAREVLPNPCNSILYPPNAWGLYGMHGNLWEWTSDSDHGSSQKIVKGGCFDAPARWSRSSSNSSAHVNNSYQNIGIRVAITHKDLLCYKMNHHVEFVSG